MVYNGTCAEMRNDAFFLSRIDRYRSAVARPVQISRVKCMLELIRGLERTAWIRGTCDSRWCSSPVENRLVAVTAQGAPKILPKRDFLDFVEESL